ncbi:MAG: PilZ domain-containing protein [Nitrospirota bacterium]|nr:MAG: PilZ domain-containing protein [Nitrospirota bacterium]
MNTDKRKSHRFPFMAIASLDMIRDGALVSVSSLVNNISYSGLGLSSYVPITEGSHVSIRVRKIKGSDNDEIVDGTVAYVIKRNDSYYMGIALDGELHPDRQPKLYEHFFNTLRFSRSYH